MGTGLKKEDTVQVIAGKEKGKRGRVLAVLRGEHKVLVERTNLIKKHLKPSKKHAQGGIIEKEAPIHISNVMLICPKCGKDSKIGAVILDDGKKHRTCKKCKEVID